MTAAEARQSIRAFAAGNRSVEHAETAMGILPGASGSVRLLCVGNRHFVAKGTRNQKGLVAEHVVGRLGQLLEAPVGEVALIEIPEALRAQPEVANMGAGLAHGTRFIENLTNREAIAYIDVSENRVRFARLCALYSLAGASDHQLFYSTNSPRVVYSLDHGHFFPGGPNWTVDSLRAAPPACVDGWFGGANLTNVELAEARSKLESIADADISDVLGGPPPEWPFTQEERNALDIYLKARRDKLLTVLPQT
jgi:hypothetical protein